MITEFENPSTWAIGIFYMYYILFVTNADGKFY